MQETRRFKPSTISRRFSVTAGFYRTCAIDGVLQHPPAEQPGSQINPFHRICLTAQDGQANPGRDRSCEPLNSKWLLAGG